MCVFVCGVGDFMEIKPRGPRPFSCSESIGPDNNLSRFSCLPQLNVNCLSSPSFRKVCVRKPLSIILHFKTISELSNVTSTKKILSALIFVEIANLQR